MATDHFLFLQFLRNLYCRGENARYFYTSIYEQQQQQRKTLHQNPTIM